MQGHVPRLTVLMAVYNGGVYLREAMDSILAQTYRDFEFLIVDDGSADGSVELINSYSDPRIRLLRNVTNRGLPQSLNRGIAEARGELVARQDADDLSDPRRLAMQVAFLDAHLDVALVGSWFRKIDASGAVLGERQLPSDPVAVRWALRFFSPIVHTAAMWRREVVTSVAGTYDERISHSQDYDYWMRIADHLPVANVPESLVAYRVQPGSMTSTYAGVSREFSAIAVGAMMRALGWSGTVADNESRFLVMSALLYGPWRGDSADELVRGADDVWALHAWFCDRFDLGRDERARQRADIRSRLRRTLARHAARFLRRGPRRDAVRTLTRALRDR